MPEESDKRRYHLSTDGGEPDGVYDVTDFMQRGYQKSHIDTYMRWLMMDNNSKTAVLIEVDECGRIHVMSEYHPTT